ncbi:MAG: biotin/lipoate A/B protein ligase family protein [Candidatus Aminicenantaceae bacterium]
MHKSSRKKWELIADDVPLKGSLNMAVDEYLFRALGNYPQTYLRFYQWEKPTVSLGYSQDVMKFVDVDFCQKNGIDIVRRITGGKLVLHHKELTYSVSSSDIETFTSKLSDSYRLISQAIIHGLKKMGLRACLASDPPSGYARGNLPCFSYPARNEIEVEGKKIVGSAQKRVGTRFIQHGSIPLEENESLLELISSLEKGKSRERMTSLSQALGRKIKFNQAVEYMKYGFSEYFGIDLRSKVFNKREMEAIFKIQRKRYENNDWTFLRKES